MMANLFTIFDPATPNLASSNWMTLTMVFFIIPLKNWIFKSKMEVLMSLTQKYIVSEFSPLYSKGSNLLILSLSTFLLIAINNTAGLFPYVFTATSHMSINLGLSMSMWTALMLAGWSKNYKNLLVHLIPQGTPFALMPLMVLIETVSSLIRPWTLAIRLACNMVAGHLLISLISSAAPIMTWSGQLMLAPGLLAMTVLELAVALVQGYVFSILLVLYMAESTE